MWNEDLYQKTLDFFLERSNSDPIARKLVWLLLRSGVVPMYDSVPMYNWAIEVVLTQRIKFKHSGVMKRNLSELMGTRFFSPSMLLDKIKNDKESLLGLGIKDYVIDICQRVSERALELLCGEERELTISEIEGMVDLKGFSQWSVNVTCINYTFSPLHDGFPYNALTNFDPVVKRGFFWTTGVEPFNSVLDQLTAEYNPYAGVITRYLWEAFNYGRIVVKLPSGYKKWWNKGVVLEKPFPDDISGLDGHLKKCELRRSFPKA